MKNIVIYNYKQTIKEMSYEEENYRYFTGNIN